jgi:hypothetical protein
MRGLRSTLLLLVALAGLGGYIYYSNSKPAADTDTEPKLFAGLDTSTISDLTVKAKNGDVTTLKKDAAGWKLVSPIDTAAAEVDASGVVNVLGDVRVVRVLEAAPTNLQQYGLDDPKIRVEFKTADGKTSGKLLVGNATVTGGNLYAKKNDEPRVILIGQYHEASLNKTTFDLRDKRIVKIDPATVTAADVTANGKTIALTKAAGEWTMHAPIVARADASAAESLVGHVESAEMKSVASASPSPEDLKKFGLDKPRATVHVQGGGTTTTFLVGGKADDGTAYIRVEGKPDVYTIDGANAEDFLKGPEDYRKHELFDFRAFNATRVEITREGKTLTLERVRAEKAGTADTWKRLTPTAGDAEREKVESFLASLADIRAVSFVDNKSLALPGTALTVVAKFDEGKKEERVTFGKQGDAAYATRQDDAGAAKIDAEKFAEAIKSFDELAK